MNNSIETLAVNTIRTLSIDAINSANSGHPGLPMGAAPMAYALWAHHLNHNSANAKWFNRDRFILSAGHGSSLLYSLLHLAGYNVSLEDLKSFRKLNSRTPGHPEPSPPWTSPAPLPGAGNGRNRRNGLSGEARARVRRGSCAGRWRCRP